MSKIARAALDLRSLATGRISGTDPMIHKKKPHRPLQGSEADRLFCCLAGRGTNIICAAKIVPNSEIPHNNYGLFA